MKDPRFAKFVVLINGLVPLTLMAWDTRQNQLGPNPPEFILRTTGMLALIFLMLSLLVTPLRKISGWNGFSHFRRTLGLFAFFYGCVHLLVYFALNESFNFAGAWKDILNRRFIFVGMTALLLMTPLAITSTNAMIKRLGAAKWKRLHKLVYLAAIAAVLHYWLLVKADTRQPLAFAFILALLLVYRLVADRIPSFRNRRRAPAGRVTQPGG